MEEEPEDANPFNMPKGIIFILNAVVVWELHEYRNNTRHLFTHYKGSMFWNNLPFEIDPAVWFDYYGMLKRLTNLFPHKIMHVHGRVTVPREATPAVRNVVYRMFLYNTPFFCL